MRAHEALATGAARPLAGLRVCAVAGEASGDGLLAPVVAALVAGGAQVTGVGGPRAESAGLVPVVDYRGLAAHGLVEAAGSLPAVVRALGRLRTEAEAADVALLVDFPELNERLAQQLRGAGRRLRAGGGPGLRWGAGAGRAVPVVRLAPPQAWAWRPWRAADLKLNAVNACLFAFEAEWLRARGVHATWVGHPLADRPPPPWPARPGLALLPGSRASAVARLLPEMAAALAHLPADLPVHLACAPGLEVAWLERLLGAARGRVQLSAGVEPALAAATVAVAGAGTATLDAALAERAVLTLARLHPVSAVVARRLVRTRSFALPNLCWGAPRLPELVQEAVTPAAIAAGVADLLAAGSTWRPALAALRAGLGRPAWAARVAGLVVAATRDAGSGA